MLLLLADIIFTVFIFLLSSLYLCNLEPMQGQKMDGPSWRCFCSCYHTHTHICIHVYMWSSISLEEKKKGKKKIVKKMTIFLLYVCMHKFSWICLIELSRCHTYLHILHFCYDYFCPRGTVTTCFLALRLKVTVNKISITNWALINLRVYICKINFLESSAFNEFGDFNFTSFKDQELSWLFFFN